MDALRQVFETEGREQEAGGNAPLLLNDPGSAWLLVRGRAEVFSVAVKDGRPTGVRRHFFTAHEDDLLLGMDLEGSGGGMGLLVVGLVGTRLRQLPVERVRALGADGTTVGPLSERLDRWVLGLCEGVVRRIVPRPRADVQLDPGQVAEVGAGLRARPRKGVLWLEHRRGAQSLFIGMEELLDLPQDVPFPVAHEAWLQAIEPGELGSVETQAALARGVAWIGLEALHGAVFRCELHNARLETVDELNRMRAKAARDRQSRESSLAEIASVLAERRPPAPVVEEEDALLAAVRLAGHHQGVPIVAPSKSGSDEQGPRQPLQEIARASRIRIRPVVLRDEWWKLDGGAFVGAMEEGRRPIALIPTSPTSYELHDPSRGTRRPVTPELAAEIHGRAHMLYRPFPAEALTPLRLLAFAARGLGPGLRLPILVGVGGGVLGMLAPYFIGLLVDRVIPEAARNRLVQLAVILAIVSVVTTLFEVVRSLSVLRIEARMSTATQPAMWDRLLSLPAGFFRRFSSGDLAQRAQGVDQVRRVLSGVTMGTIMSSLFSVFTYALLFYYSWKLALVATGLVTLALGVALAAAYAKVRIQRQIVEVEGRISGLVLQLLSGVAKLRVTGSESRAFSQWARAFAEQNRLTFRAGSIENLVEVFNASFPLITSAALFYAVLWLAEQAAQTGDPPLSPGDFVAFNAALGSFLMQTLNTGLTAMQALAIVPLYERARPILEARPEVDTTKADPGELAGEIEVSRVTFRYQEDGPTILSDISLRIEPGEYVAIVGPSGSGKSTLLRLLLGLETPETGCVYYDGRDLALLDVQRLRRRIGVVAQSGAIRTGSIFSNIAGSLPLRESDAWEAARMAGFDEDIRQMPMGMHTVVQQGGGTLSGGQRQRLIIARAIVTRPRILFFDEATSALDNRTQAIVSESLRELQATRVVIAHRLSTIIGADRIHVMQAGRIVQQGGYQELIGREGLFAELVKRQVA